MNSKPSFIILLLTLFAHKAYCQLDSLNIQNVFDGVWYLDKGLHNSISLPNESPVAKISFEKCDCEIENNRFSNPIIRKLRGKDIFRNIRTVEFDTSGRVVDTAYWTTKLYATSLDVSSYGKKYKKYFIITSISEDSIVIDRTDIYRKASATDTFTLKSSRMNYKSTVEDESKKTSIKSQWKKWLIWW